MGGHTFQSIRISTRELLIESDLEVAEISIGLELNVRSTMRLTHGRGYITGPDQPEHRRMPSVCRPSLLADGAAVDRGAGREGGSGGSVNLATPT